MLPDHNPTMEFSQSLHLILTISSLFSVVLQMKNNLAFAGPSGLTLKLIHIDSPESPLYPGILTREERIRRDFQRSKARHQQLKASINSWRVRNNNNNNSSSSSTSHSDIIKPPLSFSPETHFYLVKLGLGTFPSNPTFKNYFFILDTGSDLLWLQCQGCNPCYPQVGDDYYPAGSSTTYRVLICGGKPCTYNEEYADGASTSGEMSTDRLVVNSDDDRLEQIPNIVFGCGLRQVNFEYEHDDYGQPMKTEIAGTMGLGGGDESFIRQLGKRGYEEKFAYCFELWTHNGASNTYLRFGSDADIRGGVIHSTPMFYAREPIILYYVDLRDISIAGVPVGYTRDDLILDHTGAGGCIFDSGTPWTLITKLAYDKLENHLIQYFSNLNVHTTDDTPDEYDTCFTKPNGFNAYPTITFHFLSGAYLDVQPEAGFYVTDDIFCLAMLQDTNQDGGGGPNVTIGAIQQANHRVMYDVGDWQISWAREECGSHS